MNATCWKMKNMWQYQRRKPKERGCVCWGSLVRRHIKAIQLIDEAFYKWRVKSSCHSLSFFFFLNCCLSLFHLPLLSYHSPPVVVSSHSSHLTFELEGCCGHGITKSPSALLRQGWQQTLCFNKPWWYLPLWDHPQRLKCILFPSGWYASSSQPLKAVTKVWKHNHRQREPGLQRILAPGWDKCSTEKLLCCM